MVQAGPQVIARLLLLAVLLLPAAAAAQQVQLKVPPGFHVDVFAADLGGVRLMVLDPAGTLLVSVPSRGRVLALPDRNGDGKADATHIVMDRLHQPHGLAFKDGALYITETGRVLRDRKSTRLNSSHIQKSRMPSSA